MGNMGPCVSETSLRPFRLAWPVTRLVPIMLLKLPIMLWSNAPEFLHFLSLIIMSISNVYFFNFPNTVQFCLSS